MPDVDEWLDSFDPHTYRELLASESLDPDQLDVLIEVLKLGFSAVVSTLQSAWSGQSVEIPPSAFDPTTPTHRARHAPTSGEAVHCGPNQMARLMSGMVELI